MKAKLQWGLLGTARINRRLIPPLRVSPRNVLSAVASRSAEKAEAYAREWKIPRTFGSYEAMLADPQIDVVYISLPNHLHVEWTLKALRAGKHVLCEKPLALTPGEVDAVAAAVRETGRVAAEAFMYRHHALTFKVKELLDGGAIGRVQAVYGSFTFRLEDPANVRLVPEYGGGSIWDVGCYPVSYTRYALGAEPLEAFAWQVTGSSGVDVLFAGTLRFPGERLAQFTSGFRPSYYTMMEFLGDEGTLLVPRPYQPGEKSTLFLQRNDQEEKIRVAGQELYIGEVEDMADAVLEGKPPRVSLEFSRGNAAALAALAAAAQAGRPVPVGT